METNLVRFGVSLDKKLLKKFDKNIEEQNYSTRSKAIADLISQSLIKQEKEDLNKNAAGSITLVFDHHKRELVNTLTEIQHDYHSLIISSQHIHLDHHDCLEMVVVKGKIKDIKKLANDLQAVKGVRYANLNIAVVE